MHQKPIDWYVSRLTNRKYFALPGYSDAEWFCMMNIREGDKTGLGQIISNKHGNILTNIMIRRCRDPKWLFAIPNCIWELPQFTNYGIDQFLKDRGIDLGVAYERDTILDNLARDAGLYPLINQLQEMDTVIIGPKELEKLDFLDYKLHIPISSPNLHMEKNGIETAVNTAVKHGYKAVYLVSAGVSAPVIIDKLYENNPNNYYIDCGSIWDAFVGIGGQREWRANLYANPAELKKWKERNLYGK